MNCDKNSRIPAEIRDIAAIDHMTMAKTSGMVAPT